MLELLTPTEVSPFMQHVSKDLSPSRRVYLTDSDFGDSPVCLSRPWPISLPVPLPQHPVTFHSAQPDQSILEISSLSLSDDRGDRQESRSRSHSIPSLAANDQIHRRRPLQLEDLSSLQHLSSSIQSNNVPEPDVLARPVSPSSSLELEDSRPVAHPRVGKIKQLTGDDDAQAFHNAKLAQAKLPRYLRPTHDDSEIKIDSDGSVDAGTLRALVERMLIDPLSKSSQCLPASY